MISKWYFSQNVYEYQLGLELELELGLELELELGLGLVNHLIPSHSSNSLSTSQHVAILPHISEFLLNSKLFFKFE